MNRWNSWVLALWPTSTNKQTIGDNNSKHLSTLGTSDNLGFPRECHPGPVCKSTIDIDVKSSQANEKGNPTLDSSLKHLWFSSDQTLDALTKEKNHNDCTTVAGWQPLVFSPVTGWSMIHWSLQFHFLGWQPCDFRSHSLHHQIRNFSGCLNKIIW